jgi:hypothetical protein
MPFSPWIFLFKKKKKNVSYVATGFIMKRTNQTEHLKLFGKTINQSL